ncbi:uncharacterized protein LOC128266562 [Drosophila gunungcola]|uniref:uncharacterized protein LOC128266562 n=1 Tax=Drosophila gunungcola TaxID=103775 RepID=UPI0022E8C113|nr:uncharacterized protein LOC128266562 [Drosophila gunungcola]
MPAVWMWVWMLLAVMNLTLGQSISEEPLNDNEASNGNTENYIKVQPKSAKFRSTLCTKCYPFLYPKDKYYVLPKRTGTKKRHNVVFLMEDRKTGRTIKVAFKNGLKNDKNVRVLKGFRSLNSPCREKPGRCVYRLVNRKTFRTYKVDFKTGFKNKKKVNIIKLIP